MKTQTALLLLLGGAALIAQYGLLLAAMCTPFVHMPACVPNPLGGYKDMYHGWDKGKCFTEEQLWCRAHPGKHPDCRTADCRAEEVRLSIPRSDDPKRGERVYDGCPQEDVDRIYDHMQYTWDNPYRPPPRGVRSPSPPPPLPPPPQPPHPSWPPFDARSTDRDREDIEWGGYGACVPKGSKRSIQLQQCPTDQEAAYRGLYYSPRRRISARDPPKRWVASHYLLPDGSYVPSPPPPPGFPPYGSKCGSWCFDHALPHDACNCGICGSGTFFAVPCDEVCNNAELKEAILDPDDDDGVSPLSICPEL